MANNTNTAMTASQRDRYREQFAADLARLIGCERGDLPASVPKATAMEYLHLKGKRTINEWTSKGTYGIQTVRVGRYVEVMSDWLIEMKLNGVRMHGDADDVRSEIPDTSGGAWA